MFNGIYELELECIENAIVVETPEIDETSTDSTVNVKVNIPKLMPLIKLEEANKKLVVISKNILLNSSDSIKDTTFKLYSSNYIDVPASVELAKKLSYGDSVMVFIPNKNITNMKIVEFYQ